MGCETTQFISTYMAGKIGGHSAWARSANSTPRALLASQAQVSARKALSWITGERS